MTSAANLLQLMWLASPALPIDGFSYSEGQEAAVDTARVTTEAEAANWLLDQFDPSLARGDTRWRRQTTPARLFHRCWPFCMPSTKSSIHVFSVRNCL